ncbi:MAG: hypothetical protein KAW12_10405 [Candidatus Aminicenantes bacterium]|nr:hypothetical protein [Candidatus Aminicenantes bacterium]
MQFARKIINSEQLSGIIDLPGELKKRKVEIIVLPVKDPVQAKVEKKDKRDLLHGLMKKPIVVDNFVPLSREESHERKPKVMK